jgi:poly [ADP-ribose] polymerase
VTLVEPANPTFREIADFVIKSQVKTKSIKVKSVFTLKRSGEFERFKSSVPNQRQLFHGSRIKNWVGILSRGILMPKIVAAMGVTRTDAGWLGNGIYFGDASCTSAFYTSPGKKGTRFMAVARVGLGKMKDYTQITYGLSAPPPGHDSCHGVRRGPGIQSQFDDDEYVIYDPAQQRLEYLVEFTL